MHQRPDYTVLDHLTEICEIVDFNFRYLYVNNAAAEWEDIPREKLIGYSVLEVHPESESSPLILHLKECLEKRKSVEFEDQPVVPENTIMRWKIKVDPVADGAFIHSAGLSVFKTKVKIKKNSVRSMIANNGRPQTPVDMWSAGRSMGWDPLDLQIEGWLDELDLRTRETNEHIFRVTDATLALAKMAGVPEKEMLHIRHGALLHDIGNIGVPDAILLKHDKLTAQEREIVRKHPIYAHDLFYPMDHLRSCLSIPYSHHEWWNGTGYPLRLKGDQIPLPARLFAVADVWDRLSFDRVYGKAWPREKIKGYIQEQSGCQFDPNVVDLFFHAQKEFMNWVL